MSYEQRVQANKGVCFDLMDHLRRAFEEFINTYHKPVAHIDAFMGVHNFHKLIIQDIADRDNLTAKEKELFFLMAADTFTKGMRAAALKLAVQEAQAPK